MRVAAIDIGTNSTRLLIGEVDHRDGPLDQLDRRMTITRLGQDVDATRRLAPDAIERTLAALREYRAAMDALGGVAAVRATATSAARDATNRDDFFGPASEIVGTGLELLSGDDEAALSFLGATTGLDGTVASPYLVVDIGGGSTEFVVGTTEPEGKMSVDIGCVRLSEAWLHSDPPAPEELSQAVHVVREHIVDVMREVPAVKEAKTLIGLAGTVTTVAAIELGLTEYDPQRIHHARLTHSSVEDIFRTLATESAAERRHNPGLEPGRVDVIVGGVIILVTILRSIGFDELLVSEADILDGLVRSLAPAR
ncbi:MAG TPA: Ppx/GppA phosphatase family protein [Acidimicrobiia bacterium]|jgi:exopolyphosphatase/guanosine-5'-triphosphate,3'-diphosphate pyrophosphatase